MIIINLGLTILFLVILVKFADYAITYSSKIAKTLKMHEFIVSFFIIAVISVLPEATISLMSAIRGDSQLGLGTLLGSNVADLTLVLGIATLFSSKGIKVKDRILKDNFLYLILLFLPLLLGFDGRLSRIDGGILVALGVFAYSKIYKGSKKSTKKFTEGEKGPLTKNLILLILSLAIILVSAFFTVKYVERFAEEIKIPAMLIGITIIALGTCLPELAFSIKAVKRNHDQLALGNILGTVVIDATILLGVISLISPIVYHPYKMYLLGGALFLGAIFLFGFMKSDKALTKKEGLILIFFYILFIMLEFVLNKIVNV